MHSDAIALARELGYAAIALTLVLLLYILILRGWMELRERRRRRLWLLWRPLCIGAASGLPTPDALPSLDERTWPIFFRLWRHYLVNLHGEAHDGLRRLGRRMGLHHIAIRTLNGKPTQQQLIAAIVISGWLRDARAWEHLSAHLRNRDSLRSFAAAQALARIDPRSALREIVPMIALRPDWSRHLVAGLLMEAGPERVSGPLRNAILVAPPSQALALLRLLPFADVSTGNIVLFRYLYDTQDPEWLTACLKAARSPKVLSLVRDRLTDSHGPVRVEAANALSRLGDDSDIARLQPLLCDREWWVRYRAAQAIGELSHRNEDRMAQIRRAQTDRYAADMLDQVVAEWSNA